MRDEFSFYIAPSVSLSSPNGECNWRTTDPAQGHARLRRDATLVARRSAALANSQKNL
jgi:hypothetical protein